VHVIRLQNLSPEFRLTPFNEIPSLLLEHRILVGNGNELVVTEALCIRNVRQIRITSFTELPNNERFVKLSNVINTIDPGTGKKQALTLLSFKNASGLLLLSM
jgi:hypothetical protein